MTSLTSAGLLRSRWEAEDPAFGMWAVIPSSLTAELAAATGYHFVCVDLQHGLSDERTMISMFQGTQAAGATPLARVAWNEPWLIMRALDLGALGVIVPLVGSAEEAARAVAACKYPPHGNRSYGPIRAEIALGSAPQGLADDILCFVMVETAEGLEHVDAIARTPGLDGIYIGPADLSLALGLSPRHDGGDVLDDAIARVKEACREHGLVAGIHCAGGSAAHTYAALGFDLITVGMDSSFFAATIEQELAHASAR